MNVWIECWNCEEGYSHHDCGEDTCCCLYPENNVRCDICRGRGGWYSDDGEPEEDKELLEIALWQKKTATAIRATGRGGEADEVLAAAPWALRKYAHHKQEDRKGG